VIDIEEEMRVFRDEVIWPTQRAVLRGEVLKLEGRAMQAETKLLLLRKIRELVATLAQIESPESLLLALGPKDGSIEALLAALAPSFPIVVAGPEPPPDRALDILDPADELRPVPPEEGGEHGCRE
jgi:hypothetical protein